MVAKVAVQERLHVCTVTFVVCALANREISRDNLVVVVPALVPLAAPARTEARTQAHTEVVDFPATLSNFHTCKGEDLFDTTCMITFSRIFNFLTSPFILFSIQVYFQESNAKFC